MSFGTGELIVILCIILILFGGKKLPEFARSLGKGIREFKKACNECEEEIEVAPKQNNQRTLPKSTINSLEDKAESE